MADAASVRRVKKAFKEFDTDGNGLIELSELSAVLAELSQEFEADPSPG